jgi:preprotein translocase subunit SecA
MEHLQTIEYIREGIGLRGYGQTDPLIAYKKETYDTFQTTLKNIRDQASRMIFHLQARQEPAMEQYEEEQDAAPLMFNLEDMPPEVQEQHGIMTQGAATAVAPVALGNIDWKRVGRNDACPCGSGKKFKACHYPKLRQEGVI